MPETLVLDASAAIAVLHREPTRDAVLAALRGQASSAGEVCVPGHFWLEIANVLIRRYRYTPRQVAEAVRILDEFAVRTIDLDRPLWLLTIDRMQRFGLASYDAAYLALADVTDGSLLTLDVSLAAAAGIRAIRMGPLRLAETQTEYRVSNPNEVWAEFGSYLAELRRAVAAG